MLRAARREPSAILLATQLAGLLLYPFMEDNAAGRALLTIFGVVVLWLVLNTVAHSPASTAVALVLGAPATVLLLVQAATDSAALQPYSAALEAVLYFYAAGALIAYMLRDHQVTRDELFAVGATFTLVAWGFAYAYLVCQAADAGSFGAPRRWVDLLFLSVTSLTSVGLSDITPVRSFARSLVMLEELAGLAYVAMLVSRVVGLTVMARRG
jgi:Ion channel